VPNSPRPTGTVTPTPTITRTPTPIPPFENIGGAGACADGIDNDLDNFLDCTDPDCATSAPCGVTAPAMSLPMTAVLLALLLFAGLLGGRLAKPR
jgi:hypothetical protein